MSAAAAQRARDVLPERLRWARRSAGLDALAAATKAGLAERTIYTYESGSRRPYAATLAALASAYGVSADWLLGLE